MAQGDKPPEGPDVKVRSGYRFLPTPEELIRDYLNHWIAGRPIEELSNIVRRADVYGSDPAKLTEEHKTYGHDGKWYFLTVAKWKGGRGGAGAAGRINRCVEGGGTWHNSQRRRVIDGCGDRQAFEYRAPGNKKTDWLMEEIASNLPAATTDEGIMVICKVYLSPRAKEVPAPEPDEEERQETDVVVRSKRPRREQHGFPQEARVYDAPAPEPLQPEAGFSNAGEGGETSQATTTTMDYCPTTHTSDGSSNALHCDGRYGDVAIKPEAYDDDFGDFAINAEGELVYVSYGDGGIGTQAQMPLAMQNSNGEMTWFAPNPMYGHDAGSNEEVRQEEQMPLAMHSSNGEMTRFAPMDGHGVDCNEVGRQESHKEDDVLWMMNSGAVCSTTTAPMIPIPIPMEMETSEQ